MAPIRSSECGESSIRYAPGAGPCQYLPTSARAVSRWLFVVRRQAVAQTRLASTRPRYLISESPRSGRRHKAWGASPRMSRGKNVQARGVGDSI